MAYSSFKSLKYTINKLQLEETDINLFPTSVQIEPTNWLKETLAIAERMPLTNEKSKSERVISPILTEVAMRFEKQITLYSGEDLAVEGMADMVGECDFFFAKHPRKMVMRAPIIALVEAKDEDFEYGQAQCTAQMYASLLFNEQNNKPIPFIYGCAVTGDAWKFLKLEKNILTLDIKTYYLNDLPNILGVFDQIINMFLKEA